MSRPMKKGLSYFPLDTGFLSNRKIQRLSLKYGSEGISVFLAVLCETYGTNGYFTPVDDSVFFDIGFLLHTSEKKVKEIVDYCVKIRLFDKQMYVEKLILTSSGIQLRYEVISRRNKKKIDPLYRLISEEEVSAAKTPVIAAKTRVIVTETPVNVAETPPNINGNINRNKKEIKTNLEDGKYQFSKKDGDAARRAELLQMAEAATAGRRNA